MTTFLATFVLLLLVVGGMAVGVMVQGRRLRGSCGMTADDCACSALRARSCPHVHLPEADESGSDASH